MFIKILCDIENYSIAPIDSIAKQLNPQADVSNVYWWISLVVLLIVGIAVFIVKHYFKGKILDGIPSPRIKILDGTVRKDVLALKKSDVGDTNALLSQLIQDKMAELEQKYPSPCLDPYRDMMLTLPGRFTAANNYNADIQSYKEGMMQYYTRTIADQLMSECLKEVKFVLFAKGKKACNNLSIEMAIKGKGLHVYSAESRLIKVGKHDIAPENNNIDRSSEFYAFFPNKQEEYKYGEWQLKEKPSISNYTCNSLVCGCPNEDVVKPIFVDIRYEQELVINWKVNGADIPESGEKGELVIRVE